MFGFGIIKINRLNKTAEYFNLLNLQHTKDLIELQSIIKLFNLENLMLKCIARVTQSSKLLNFSDSNSDIKVIIKKTKKLLLNKEPCYDIEVEFYGKSLNVLIELAAKESEALYIIPQDIQNKDIEFILNDNDHNYIRFSTQKYNVNEIRTKIKEILKKNK